MLNKFFSVLYCSCLVTVVAGQSLVLPAKPLQQRYIGSAGQDELVSACTNWRGDIASVGNAAKGDNGGQDISLALFDSRLGLLTERHIGRKGDDGAHQIITLPDGRYLLAGYSEKPGGKSKVRANYFGKSDGWALILNENGHIEREILLGTAQDDAFTAAAALPDGSVWLAGNSGAQAWVVLLSPALEVVFDKKFQYHLLPTAIYAATNGPDGTLFMTGQVTEYDQNKLWIGGINPAGKMTMEKTFPTAQAECGTGITTLGTAQLAITGNVTGTPLRENGCIALLDQTGVLQSYTTLGGREFDQSHCILQLADGRLMTGGGSASFERGSRRISAWLSLLSATGTNPQDFYYGSKLDDEVRALLQHPDGRLIALGTTAKKVLKMRQGWLFELSTALTTAANLENIRISMPTDIQLLAPENAANTQRMHFVAGLKNTTQVPMYQVSATILNATSLPFTVNQGRSIMLPPLLPNQEYQRPIPLLLSGNITAGTHELRLQYYVGTTPVGAPQTVRLRTNGVAEPQLSLSIAAPDSALVLGQTTQVRVVARNTGNATAQEVNLAITAPPGVKVPANAVLGAIAPGAEATFWLPVTPENTSVGQSVFQLLARADDATLEYFATSTATFDVRAATLPVNSTPAQADYTVAVWVYPNPDNFERSELVWTQEDITVQIKIVSNKPVQKQQFCLEINGVPCSTGAKFDEVQIKGDKASRTFSQSVRLQKGENVLQAVVQGPNGPIKSEPLNIAYSPAKPNLHLICIGVPAADLKYTTKDARDFCAAMTGLPNAAFDKIFVDTLFSEEKTTKTAILKTLRRVQYRYAALQILPKDLLVIFVSGHGMGSYDGSFRLAASDYDAPFLEETSLDFEQDIINYIQTVPCRKLFIIDACHSGNAPGSGIAHIAERKNGLNMLLSCQPDEFSYEDDAWQNGAFTHALMKGLQQFGNAKNTLDLNQNRQLDVRELFDFMQKEVPALVDKKRPKTKTGQRPNLFLADGKTPLVILE